MDHVGQLDVVLDGGGNAPLQVVHLCVRPPIEALSGPRGQSGRGAGSEFGKNGSKFSRNNSALLPWLGDVKPLFLPSFDGVDECAGWPHCAGKLADDRTAAVCVFACDTLRLDVEYLKP